jgi:TPR repeat protein
MEAVRWYRMAAEKGNDDAMYRLAAMYNNGSGVHIDFAEGSRWNHRAADKGNKDAMFNLGSQYLMGEGVAKSNEEAYFWFNLSAAASSSSDGLFANMRDIAADKLSPDELQQIQRRCEDWVRAHPKIH